MKLDDCIYKGSCERECSRTCLKFLEMNYLLTSSNIPESKQKINTLIAEDCDVQSFMKLSTIRDSIVDFVSNGNNLYIYSSICGNGKTTWAIKLMLQYFNEVWVGNGFTKRGIFVNVPTFLTKCKTVISNPDSDFECIRKSLNDVDLVIFDDIAVTKLSDYDFNVLLNFIDQRSLIGKSTIYTGNVEPYKLNNYVGDRLSSRILCGTQIQLKGKDMRNGRTSIT